MTDRKTSKLLRHDLAYTVDVGIGTPPTDNEAEGRNRLGRYIHQGRCLIGLFTL